MRLALSSAAAPGASLGELLDAIVRRGLAAIELVEGHGHGMEPSLTLTSSAASTAQRAAAAGVAIAGFRLSGDARPPGGRDIDAMARFARALGGPLLIPLVGAPAGLGAREWRRSMDVAAALRGAGGGVSARSWPGSR